MSFCYATGSAFSKTELCQGDVLDRTDEINRLLEQFHPHYFKHNKNLYFMVLTQSCDLALHDGPLPKAPFITVAPVRPLSEVIDRRISGLVPKQIKTEAPVLSTKSRNILSDYLRSLINNNVAEFFYLSAGGTTLADDCCAFLRLPLAIRTDVHYQDCLKAKILQLEDSFQAKLGYLLGQIYARVGTKDWARADLDKKVKSLVEFAAHYIDDEKMRSVEKRLIEAQAQDANRMTTVAEIKEIEGSVESKRKAVVEQAVKVAKELLTLDDEHEQKLLSRLKNDPVLSTHLGRW